MQMPKNYAQAPVKTGGEFEKLEAGGHVLYIKSIIETTSKSSGNPMVVIDLDVAIGEHQNYYRDLFNKFKMEKWPLVYRQLVTEEQIGYYKGVLKALKDSNNNFPVNQFTGNTHNLQSLIGMQVGACLQEEDYENKSGEIKTNLKVMFLCNKQDVLDGKIKAPEPKKIIKNNNNNNSNQPSQPQAPSQPQMPGSGTPETPFGDDGLPF